MAGGELTAGDSPQAVERHTHTHTLARMHARTHKQSRYCVAQLRPLDSLGDNIPLLYPPPHSLVITDA